MIQSYTFIAKIWVDATNDYQFRVKKKRFIFIYYFHFLSYGNLLWLYSVFLKYRGQLFFYRHCFTADNISLYFPIYCFLILVFAEMPRWKSAISKITVLNKISRRSKQNCGFSEKQSTECQTNLWLSMSCLYGYRPTLSKQHSYQF